MNCIIIELDTTSPNLEIYAPTYTTMHNIVEVNIESNEVLDEWQEIYTIDEDGTRRDYVFKIDGKMINGIINPMDYPRGLLHLHIKVRDEVNNESQLYVKTITIKESFPIISLTIKDFSKDILIKDKERVVEIKERELKTELNINTSK